MSAEKLVTIDEVEQSIIAHKDALHRKVKLLSQIEAEKKEAAAAFREQIKEVKEEIQGEMDVLDELMQRKRDLHTDEVLADE